MSDTTAWLGGGEAVDQDTRALQRTARNKATEGSVKLREWWTDDLTKAERHKLGLMLDELKTLAEQADADQAAAVPDGDGEPAEPDPLADAFTPERDAPAAAAANDASHEADESPPATKDWSIPTTVVGQEKKLLAIYAMLDGKGDGPKCETAEDVDVLWEAHETFFEKLGAIKRSAANQRFGDRKIMLAQAQAA